MSKGKAFKATIKIKAKAKDKSKAKDLSCQGPKDYFCRSIRSINLFRGALTFAKPNVNSPY